MSLVLISISFMVGHKTAMRPSHRHHVRPEDLEFLNLWVIEHLIGDIEVMRIFNQLI